MSVPTKITDVAARAVAMLLSQFHDSPRLTELKSIFAAECQSLESLKHDLITERMLASAVGAQLEQYGKIVGLPKLDWTDTEYRERISVQLFINRTHATPDETAYIVSRIVGVPVKYIQYGRAHFELEWIVTEETGQSTIDLLNEIMPKIAPSGVSWALIEGFDAMAALPSSLVVAAHFDQYNEQDFDLDYVRDTDDAISLLQGGSPAIITPGKFGNGCLELKDASYEHLKYYHSSFLASLLQTFTIEFWLRPGYSGTPTYNQRIISYATGASSQQNLASIFHINTGYISVRVYDSVSSAICSFTFAWSPTADQWYHHALCVDVTTGATRYFIDGAQCGTTQTETGTRSSGTLGYLTLGDYSVLQNDPPDFDLDELLIWDEVRYTEAFTPRTEQLLTQLPFRLDEEGAGLDEGLLARRIDTL